jgi:hypothetical protein
VTGVTPAELQRRERHGSELLALGIGQVAAAGLVGVSSADPDLHARRCASLTSDA